eukprot:TRINITY_DN6417_c0_g1_i1.p1 TRINITY_DN6417_c0_g1~~TRINITY_DN6417_c0_g1_i1.p1  ORF type:complete len:391 (+),score=93.71 TRINITY_DN6417_c0_g1_i1:78-1250(+)
MRAALAVLALCRSAAGRCDPDFEAAGAAPSACSASADCGVAGACVDGRCECEPPWTGRGCGELAISPAPRTAGMKPPGKTTWGGSPVLGDDGFYYMFTSLNRNGSVAGWYNTSVIVRGRSETALGPYEWDGYSIVLDVRPGEFDGTALQNPVAVKLPNKQGFAVYYTGCNCTDSSLPCWFSLNCTIGVAYDTTASGAFARRTQVVPALPNDPCQYVIVNPAPYVHPNGSVYLYFRGYDDCGMYVATAPGWAGPYTRRPEAVLPRPDAACRDRPDTQGCVFLEDPFVWRSRGGVFHLLMHQIVKTPNITDRCVKMSRAAHSLDGFTFELAPGTPYTCVVEYLDGGREGYCHREEPKMLLGEDGQPSHLFNVVDVGDYHSDGDSWVVGAALK